jgi:pyrroline-5-carboxylate reductase
MKTATIAIIGGGNMGTSLVGGLINDGYPADKIWMTDISAERLAYLKQNYGVNTTAQNQEAVKSADTVIFSIKPQVFQTVTTALKPILQTQKPLVISIAAGIRENSIQTWLGGNLPIVRAMPNTPALIGCGATALFANSYVSDTQAKSAEAILRAVGIVAWVKDEILMDVVTALSGSGPAYFFLMMDVLQQAGEKMGLPSEISHALTLQTVFGAARMAMESNESLTTLRKQVTSPGGTTEQGLRVLEESNIRGILTETLNAAKTRSEELAKQFEATES